MVTVIQGNNKKKNKAPITAAIVATMMATVYSKRTLLIQFVDNDIESAEKILINYTTEERDAFAKKENEITIPIVEEGIDGLMGSIFNQKIDNDMLSSYCRTIQNLRNKNGKVIKSLLDVIPISQNDNFISNLNGKEEAVQLLIEAVQEEGMYDEVVILVDNGDENIQEMVNGFADCSVYCLNQGHETKGKVFGENVVYVVTDYESDSRYDLKTVMSNYGLSKKDKLVKVERSIHAIDAARDGRLTRFIKANRELPPYDPDYTWSEDMKHLVGIIFGVSSKNNEPDYTWEKFADEPAEMKMVEGRELTTVSEKNENTTKKKGIFPIFGRKKKRQPKTSERSVENTDIVAPDIDEFEDSEEDGFEDVGAMGSAEADAEEDAVAHIMEESIRDSKEDVSEIVEKKTAKRKSVGKIAKNTVKKEVVETKKNANVEKKMASKKISVPNAKAEVATKTLEESVSEKPMTKAQLKKELDLLGIKYTTRMTLKDLTDLYQESMRENQKMKSVATKKTAKSNVKKGQPAKGASKRAKVANE